MNSNRYIEYDKFLFTVNELTCAIIKQISRLEVTEELYYDN